MNQDNNWIDDYVRGQLAGIKFETNWLDGCLTYSTDRYKTVIYDDNPYYNVTNKYNKDIDKDEKIRNLEARVKELEAILEEEI